MNREFTRDLQERDQIFRSAVILERAIFDLSKRVYVPPITEVMPTNPVPAVRTGVSVEFQSVFVEYNLRLVEIALAIDPVIESALCDAGLSATDQTLWALHRTVAELVICAPEHPPESSELLYVPDLGTFSTRLAKVDVRDPLDETMFATRLRTAATRIARLAHFLERVIQTVDRRAVSRRAFVAQNRLFIDGVPYDGLSNYSLRYFKHVARAGGHYVSSAAIAGDAKSPNISREGQFRTERVKADVSKKHPLLLPLFENVPGVGNRLILPLPPER